MMADAFGQDSLNQRKMLESINQQRTEGKFCDIIFHLEQQQYCAHKNVLAAASPYFNSVLRPNKSPDHITVTATTNQDAFEAFLGYVYVGDLCVDRQTVHDLLYLANQYAIPKLRDHCSHLLIESMTCENCFAVKETVEKCGLTDIVGSVVTFIGDNFSELVKSKEMVSQSLTSLETMLQERKYKVAEEYYWFSLIVQWIMHDVGERSCSLIKLLGSIQWNMINLNMLYDCIQSCELFQQNNSCMLTLLTLLSEKNLLMESHTQILRQLQMKLTPPKKEESVDDMAAQMQATYEDGSEMATDLDSIQLTQNFFTGQPQDSGVNPSENDCTPGTQLGNMRPVRSSRRKRGIPMKRLADTNISQKREEPSLKEEDSVADDSDEVDLDEGEDYSPSKLGKVDTPKANGNQRVEKQSRGPGRPRKTNSMTCLLCPYKTNNSSRLEKHIEKAHKDNRTFTCSFCNFETKWNKEFFIHMKTHFSGPPYRCDFPDCTYAAERIQAIVSHRMVHTDERPYKCSMCSLGFRSRNNLTAHFRSHTGEKPYKCEVCNKHFATKNTMLQHSVIHRNERPYLCDACGFSTKYQSHLIAHRRLHTGEVFRCEHEGCGYYSPKKSQLAAHMRIHLDIRNHVCQICSKAFVESSHLRRHERIHSDNKPHKCSACPYSSTRRDKLREHVMKHHTDADKRLPTKKNSRKKKDRAISPVENPLLFLKDLKPEDMSSSTGDTVLTAGDGLQSHPQPMMLISNAAGVLTSAGTNQTVSIGAGDLMTTVDGRSIGILGDARLPVLLPFAQEGSALTVVQHIDGQQILQPVPVVSAADAQQFLQQTTPVPVSQATASPQANSELPAYIGILG